MCGLVLVGWIVDGHVRVFVWLCGRVCWGGRGGGGGPLSPEGCATEARDRSTRGASGIARVEGLIAVTKKNKKMPGWTWSPQPHEIS